MIKKKAQMEILGLAVIIILITLIGLFVLRFVILKPVEIKREYTMKSLAVDTITAMLRTTTDCHGENIRDLLMDCATGKAIECLTPTGPEDSCTYVNKTIEWILNKTLKSWYKNYIFNVTTTTDTEPEEEFSFVNGNCTAARMIEPGIQPLPTYNNLKVRLDVCE